MKIGFIKTALFVALATLCLLPTAAQAQSAFTGVVKDTSGAVLPGRSATTPGIVSVRQ